MPTDGPLECNDGVEELNINGRSEGLFPTDLLPTLTMDQFIDDVCAIYSMNSEQTSPEEVGDMNALFESPIECASSLANRERCYQRLTQTFKPTSDLNNLQTLLEKVQRYEKLSQELFKEQPSEQEDPAISDLL